MASEKDDMVTILRALRLAVVLGFRAFADAVEATMVPRSTTPATTPTTPAAPQAEDEETKGLRVFAWFLSKRRMEFQGTWSKIFTKDLLESVRLARHQLDELEKTLLLGPRGNRPEWNAKVGNEAGDLALYAFDMFRKVTEESAA